MDRRSVITGTLFATTMPSRVPVDAQAMTLADRFAAALSAHDTVAFAALFRDDYVSHQLSAAAPPPPGLRPRRRSRRRWTSLQPARPEYQTLK
jgi:hypothetical protein